MSRKNKYYDSENTSGTVNENDDAQAAEAEVAENNNGQEPVVTEEPKQEEVVEEKEAPSAAETKQAVEETKEVKEVNPEISKPELVEKPKEDNSGKKSIKGRMTKGKLLKLVNEPVYKGPMTLIPFKYVSGNYFVFDGIERCGRYRICTDRKHCGKETKYIDGYITK